MNTKGLIHETQIWVNCLKNTTWT